MSQINRSVFSKALRNLIVEAVVFALLVFSVFYFVIGITVQRGSDMDPLIRDGDIIIYSRHAELLPTEAVVYEVSGKIRTGRIAAAAGSEIGVSGDRQLTIDGIIADSNDENGIYGRTCVPEGADTMRISNDSYYILNDRRTRMNDSRTYGEIAYDSILGRIISVIRVRII